MPVVGLKLCLYVIRELAEVSLSWSGPVWSEEVDIKVYTPVCLPPTHSHHSYFGRKAWVYGNLSNISSSKGGTETKVNLTFINEIIYDNMTSYDFAYI